MEFPAQTFAVRNVSPHDDGMSNTDAILAVWMIHLEMEGREPGY